MTKHAIVEKIKAAKVALAAEAKEALMADVKFFFQDVPEVTSVRWQQYTPYFNDGETCEFEVHEARFFGPLQEPDEEDSEVDVCYAIRKQTERQFEKIGMKEEKSWDGRTRTVPAYGYVDAKRPATERELEILQRCNDLSSLISGLGDYMQDIFGDHVQVTASATGFDVAGYDHD